MTWTPPAHSHALLKAFIWTLRDVADEDYIAARQSLRLRLLSPYLWSAQQAFEKYLKCIGALSGMPRPGTGHHLTKSFRKKPSEPEQQAILARLESFLPFQLKLSPRTQAFLEKLDEMAGYRYGQADREVAGADLLELDYAVWDVRRYAQPLFRACPDLIRQLPTHHEQRKKWVNQVNSELALTLAGIEAAANLPPITFQIPGGHLEAILSSRNPSMNDARKALIWSNPCFGSRRRAEVKVLPGFRASFSPLGFLDVVDEYKKYVHLGTFCVNRAAMC